MFNCLIMSFAQSFYRISACSKGKKGLKLKNGKLHEYRFKRTFFSIKQTFSEYQS